MLDPKGQEIGYTTRDWIWGKPHSVVKKVIPVSQCTQQLIKCHTINTL